MAIIRSIFTELSAVIGFAESLGLQLLFTETRYNQATLALEDNAVTQNVVIPIGRLASTAIADVDGYLAIHIKNGNLTVLSLDKDTWNPATEANYTGDDLVSIHNFIIQTKQN